MSSNLKKKIFLAVKKGDHVGVLNLLSSGADINAVLEDHNTLLHLVTNPEVTESLLLHGASVNAVNTDGETPLHCAIISGRSLSVVEVLLKHGANINVENNSNETPLHYAVMVNSSLSIVKKLLKCGANVNATAREGISVLYFGLKYHRNLEIIKELLEFNADFNFWSITLNRFFSPIDVAMLHGDVACAQFFIKYTVLKYYHEDHRKVTDLRYYIKFGNNSELSSFFEKCALEVLHMIVDKVNKKSCLYYYVNRSNNVKPLYISNTALVFSIIEKYSIYQDIILAKLKVCLQRAHLLDKLKDLQNCFELPGINRNSDVRQKVLLNGDCLFKIGELLSNEDILNFLIVIDKNFNSSDYSLDMLL
ncbi:alpha-latrocrustotoxin-Lt1a [Halyomorpha halys]|uniref:alpha-latrocrustotoxin-Lt1a n=1 Tax=Halyomorpha halys TaxID=286706 RepID=UPI0006D4CE99|nr:alpha-latrocrustotoxin-Lt1a [Halyomorpha halys]